MADWQTGWLTGCLADGLIDWLAYRLWMADWQTDCIAGWLTDWLDDWLTNRLWMADWQADWMDGWLVDCWLICWLAVWSLLTDICIVANLTGDWVTDVLMDALTDWVTDWLMEIVAGWVSGQVSEWLLTLTDWVVGVGHSMTGCAWTASAWSRQNVSAHVNAPWTWTSARANSLTLMTREYTTIPTLGIWLCLVSRADSIHLFHRVPGCGGGGGDPSHLSVPQGPG